MPPVMRCQPALLRLADALSTHLRMRLASAMRVRRPTESSSTMIIGLLASQACITRHLPDSLMKPVLDRPISQFELRTSWLVLWKATLRPLISTSYSAVVVISRITGYLEAADTIFTRSRALDTLDDDNPVGSLKRVSFSPIASALRFMASTKAAVPPG